VKAFFDSPLPRVFAHRGLALNAPENTPMAFELAIAAGVSYIETDVNASADGVAIVSHDADLIRLTGRTERIGDLTAAQLGQIDLGHQQGFVPLAEVLTAFPDIRFNIDIKDPAAVAPTVDAIRSTGAIDRVLVTSFSESRRRAAVKVLPGVATSASAGGFLRGLLAAKLGLGALVRTALRDVDAVQIPERALGMTTTTPRLLRAIHRAGVEVHIWTVNDPERMAELFAAGVDGIVTDRADLGVPTADRFIISGNPL